MGGPRGVGAVMVRVGGGGNSLGDITATTYPMCPTMHDTTCISHKFKISHNHSNHVLVSIHVSFIFSLKFFIGPTNK